MNMISDFFLKLALKVAEKLVEPILEDERKRRFVIASLVTLLVGFVLYEARCPISGVYHGRDADNRPNYDIVIEPTGFGTAKSYVYTPTGPGAVDTLRREGLFSATYVRDRDHARFQLAEGGETLVVHWSDGVVTMGERTKEM